MWLARAKSQKKYQATFFYSKMTPSTHAYFTPEYVLTKQPPVNAGFEYGNKDAHHAPGLQ
jgi:hypothetical protein